MKTNYEYKRKQNVVKAIQFNNTNAREVIKFLKNYDQYEITQTLKGVKGKITAYNLTIVCSSTEYFVKSSDYIIKNNSSISVLNNKQFCELYEVEHNTDVVMPDIIKATPINVGFLKLLENMENELINTAILKTCR